MHIIYIDDSKDQDSRSCVFSALAIPADQWLQSFTMVKDYRRELKKTDGIFVQKEFHAWKFISGRGRIAPDRISVERRCEIFDEILGLTTTFPGAFLTNGIFPLRAEAVLFERLLNRINRTMKRLNSYAVLICDEGKNEEYTRLARQMSVHNPIPSQFGVWQESGGVTKNIPTDRIIEDPVFKDSRRSYFIQVVDFCAYALLRRERPIESKTLYGLDKSFNRLSPILNRAASNNDPEGILRWK